MQGFATQVPLTLSGVSYEQGGRRLLDSLDFALPGGGITMILGPNGAGKSLTLKLCHGLIAPSAGSIRWARGRGGAEVRHAMVLQKPVMLRRSTFGNLTHALAATGVGAAARGARAREALAHFGLQAMARRPARQLSGGEQQRLAIARAWALAPDVLILDEPSSQLDPSATRQVEDLLRALKHEGLTILMTTHDLGQARRLADNVLFLHHGRLVEQGPVDWLEAPASEAARAFIRGDLLW